MIRVIKSFFFFCYRDVKKDGNNFEPGSSTEETVTNVSVSHESVFKQFGTPMCANVSTLFIIWSLFHCGIRL